MISLFILFALMQSIANVTSHGWCHNSVCFNFNSQDLIDSPLYTFSSVRFDNSTLQYIPKQMFSKFFHLEELDAANCGILGLLDENFSNSILKSLSLASNEITKLESKMFFGLKNLTTLNLSRNNVEKLDKKLFEYLLNLQVLNLNENLIKEIDPHIFQDTPNLRFLNLSTNPINGPLQLDVRNLTEIDLTHCGLTKLTADGEINSLNLANNQICEITTWNNTDLKLEILNLHNNSVRNLISVLIQFNNLKLLDLSQNSIDYETMEKALYNMAQLGELNLHSTKLRKFPKNLLNSEILKQLRFLDISDNFLEKLDIGLMKEMTNLRTLNLDKNQWKCLNLIDLMDLIIIPKNISFRPDPELILELSLKINNIACDGYVIGLEDHPTNNIKRSDTNHNAISNKISNNQNDKIVEIEENLENLKIKIDEIRRWQLYLMDMSKEILQILQKQKTDVTIDNDIIVEN